MKLEDLNLPIHTYNILKRANINTTDELTQFSAEQIMMIRCSRDDDLAAIIKALQEHGLSLSLIGKSDIKWTAMASALVNEQKERLKRDREHYVERFPEPLCSALKARGLCDLYDFSKVTQSYVFSIPGMTPEFLRELKEGMALFGVEFAEQKTIR